MAILALSSLTIYFSAVMLKSLHRGRSLLSTYWPWAVDRHDRGRCISGEDCPDGRDVEDIPILTVCLEYPRLLTPIQPAPAKHSALKMLQKKVENHLLFSASDLNQIIPTMQKQVQTFDEKLSNCHVSWKVVVKAQEVSFSGMLLDDIKPVVSLTGLYYSGLTGTQIQCYPFGDLLKCVLQVLRDLDRWKDTVYVVYAGEDKSIGERTSSPTHFCPSLLARSQKSLQFY